MSHKLHLHLNKGLTFGW